MRKRASSVHRDRKNSTEILPNEDMQLLAPDKERPVDAVSDMSPAPSPVKLAEKSNTVTKATNFGKRKIKRPEFLENTFESPEII